MAFAAMIQLRQEKLHSQARSTHSRPVPGACFNDGLMVEAQKFLLLLFPDSSELQKPKG